MNQQTLFDTDQAISNRNPNSLVITSKRQKPLSKAQQTFNKLTNQIDKLQKDIEKQEKDMEESLAFYGRFIHPLELKQAGMLKQLVKIFYRFSKDHKMLSKKERGTIREIIGEQLNKALQLDNLPPDEEIKHIFKDIEGIGYDRAMEEDFEEIKEETEIMFRSMGVEFDMSNVNRENFQEEMSRKAAEFQEKMKSEMENEKSRHERRKKTAKQIEKEEKEKQKEEARQRSISVIYKQLVKALHPDLERDETLKIEKEALMKEAVAAYERNDLPQLLRLEMQWLNNETNHLDLLSDEKLAIYIQLLKEQANELKMQRDMLRAHPKYQPLLRLEFGMPLSMSTLSILKKKKSDIEETLLSIEKSIRELNGNNPLAELKTIFHIYNNRPSDFIDFD